VPGSGEWFCDIDGGPEMVAVPAGKFMMGSPETELGRYDSEGPQHEVTVAHPFAVGRHAVTRGQFAAFVKATGHKMSGRWRNPGFEQDDRHPVVCISWDDAKAYAAWLEEITTRPYRLLTEAEWEYAARAGTTTPFWWGSSITPAQANYNGNYDYAGGSSTGEYRKGTVPVSSFQPNPSAAVPGTTILGTSAPPRASETATGTISSVSVWPGTLTSESLPLYILNPGEWVQGRSPWSRWNENRSEQFPVRRAPASWPRVSDDRRRGSGGVSPPWVCRSSLASRLPQRRRRRDAAAPREQAKQPNCAFG
jgi:hypothetical protein